MMHYDDDFPKTTLINVNDDECMKTNACILLRVICEPNLWLCHKDVFF